MFNIVLVEPEIPANTGNIGRTCVLTGSRLHLVGPMGFSLDDRALRRAGLAYWASLDVRTYASWDEFVCVHGLGDLLARNETCMASSCDRTPSVGVVHTTPSTIDHLATEDRTLAVPFPTVHLLTKSGARTYAESTFSDGDWLVFGKESTGLPRELLAEHSELCERIPMLGDDAVLANAEAWHESFDVLHPELERDIAGNFVDPRAGQVTSLNLSNAVAIVLYEALRQSDFTGM